MDLRGRAVSDDASETRRASRLARLHVELAEECDGLELSTAALEEVLHCRWMEAHEGRRPSYGAIIAAEEGNGPRFAGALELPNPGLVMVADAPLDDLRRFADGRTSFMVRPAAGPPALAIDTGLSGDEQSLATFSRSSGATIVQRLPSGRIRIFHADHVHSSDEGVWMSRPSSARYHESVQIRVAGDQTETARAILDLCVHSLSPAGIGASLVWYPDGVPLASRALDRGAEIVPPTLAVTSDKERPAIVHALSQLDRAVLVHPAGGLAALNVLLLAPNVPNDVRFDGGTRHNSAGRFSSAEPRALVFVVSSDGPVTVFQAGNVIASLRAAIYLETRTRECTDCHGSGLVPQAPNSTDKDADIACNACDGAGVIESQVELRSGET